jgi:hypothetical protein
MVGLGSRGSWQLAVGAVLLGWASLLLSVVWPPVAGALDFDADAAVALGGHDIEALVDGVGDVVAGEGLGGSNLN